MTMTRPSLSLTAAWLVLATFRAPVGLHVREAGSKISQLLVSTQLPVPPATVPPATRRRPSASVVKENPLRGVIIGGPACHAPRAAAGTAVNAREKTVPDARGFRMVSRLLESKGNRSRRVVGIAGAEGGGTQDADLGRARTAIPVEQVTAGAGP
jgi:hypothetical protein